MGRKFDDFDKMGVRIASRRDETGFLEESEEVAVEFVAVAVTFGNLCRAVNLLRKRARLDFAFVCAQTHSPALRGGALLVFHEVDDGESRGRIHLRGAGAVHPEHIAGELHHAHLHPEADSEERNAVFAGIFYRGDLALKPPLSESRSDKDAVLLPEQLLRIAFVQVLAVEILHLHLALVRGGSMHESLEN